MYNLVSERRSHVRTQECEQQRLPCLEVLISQSTQSIITLMYTGLWNKT